MPPAWLFSLCGNLARVGSKVSAPGGAAGRDDTAGGWGGMPSHSPQITHHPEKSHTQSRGPRYKYFISVTIVPHQNYSSTRR